MFRKAVSVAAVLLFVTGSISFGQMLEPTQRFGLGDLRHIAFSPDLRFIGSAGQGGAFLWNMETSTLAHRFEVDIRVTALTFSNDGGILFAADRATIRSWSAETGEALRTYAGHIGEVGRLLVSPNGRQLFSAGSDNTVRVWNIETAEELHQVRIPRSAIVDISLSPDGQRLATVDTFLTNCVKIWDVSSETQIAALPKTNWPGQYCLFTPAGQLVTASPDRSVLLWDLDKLQVVRSFEGITNQTDIVQGLWMPNETTLAAVSSSAVFLWNLESGQLARVVPLPPVIAAAGAPNDFIVATGSIDNNIRLRQLPGGDVLRTFKGHTGSGHSGVAFSPDGRYVLSGGSEASTRLWDRTSGVGIREFAGSPAGTATAAFSADGSKILTTVGLPEPGARLWKTETGELEREFRWSGSWPTFAALSKDGAFVAAGAQDQRVRIFDTATGALTRTIVEQGWVNRIAFAPSAPFLACGSTEFKVTVYNYETGERVHEFFENAGPVAALEFSPDGERLLIGWQGGLVRVFDVASEKLSNEIFVEAGFLDAAIFSPDGQYILTGESFPGFRATIWDARTGQNLRRFTSHRWVASALAFNADGTSILTGADYVREFAIPDLAGRLSIEMLPEARGLELRWFTGQLERATSLTGPWQKVEDAISPFFVAGKGGGELFRVRVTAGN